MTDREHVFKVGDRVAWISRKKRGTVIADEFFEYSGMVWVPVRWDGAKKPSLEFENNLIKLPPDHVLDWKERLSDD